MSDNSVSISAAQDATDVASTQNSKSGSTAPNDLLAHINQLVNEGKWTGTHTTDALRMQASYREQLFAVQKHQFDNDDRRDQRRIALCIIISVLVFLLCLILPFLYLGKEQYLAPILTGISGLLSGGLIGHSIGSKASQKSTP